MTSNVNINSNIDIRVIFSTAFPELSYKLDANIFGHIIYLMCVTLCSHFTMSIYIYIYMRMRLLNIVGCDSSSMYVFGDKIQSRAKDFASRYLTLTRFVPFKKNSTSRNFVSLIKTMTSNFRICSLFFSIMRVHFSGSSQKYISK